VSHTPGPWYWGDDYSGLYGQGEGRKREVLSFERYEGMWLAYTDHQKANAHLLVAAPDLLAALEEVVLNAHKNFEGGMDIHPEAIEIAHEAILKAKGELQ